MMLWAGVCISKGVPLKVPLFHVDKRPHSRI